MIRTHRDITYAARTAMGPGQHADVEYHISPRDCVDNEKTFITINPKLAHSDAMYRAMGGMPMWLDVCIWSEEGAKFYGGDDGVEQYRLDPEASVFDRFEININYVGMVA